MHLLKLLLFFLLWPFSNSNGVSSLCYCTIFCMSQKFMPKLFYVVNFPTFKKKQIRIFPISDVSGPLSGTVPAIVGLFIALSILLFLFCFMFKLFTQSRWARARAYADANQPPPTITLEGTHLLNYIDLKHSFQCAIFKY